MLKRMEQKRTLRFMDQIILDKKLRAYLSLCVMKYWSQGKWEGSCVVMEDLEVLEPFQAWVATESLLTLVPILTIVAFDSG
jgi:hypothetical protein